MRYLGDPDAAAITTTDLRRWLVSVKEGDRKPTTDVYVEGHRVAADVMFTWAVGDGVLPKSPMTLVEAFKIDVADVKTLTREEVLLLMNTQPENTHEGIRNRTIMALLYDTGLRVGELVRIAVEDVDLREGTIRVMGKGRRVETVPLSATMRAMLWRYIKRTRPRGLFADAGRLFVSRAGDPLSPNAVNLWMRRAKMRAGLTGRVSPHTFRHSFGTEYIKNGGDAISLQRILRHRTPDMTRRYVHLASSDVAARHADASPLSRLMKGA